MMVVMIMLVLENMIGRFQGKVRGDRRRGREVIEWNCEGQKEWQKVRKDQGMKNAQHGVTKRGERKRERDKDRREVDGEERQWGRRRDTHQNKIRHCPTALFRSNYLKSLSNFLLTNYIAGLLQYSRTQIVQCSTSWV